MFRRNVETHPVAAAHDCADCVARIANLSEQVSQLEEENRNLSLLDDALRRNTALFEALLANSIDGVMLTGADRRILRVVRGLTGFAPSELRGMLVESAITPEDQHILVDCYREIIEGRSPRTSFEVRAIRPDGSMVYLAGTLTDMLDDPNVQAVVWNYSDVTRRKREELTLAEFAAIVQSAGYSIFSKDTEGEILTWNDGARKMFGYVADEIVGRHVRILVPEELRGEEANARRLLVETGTAGELRTERLSKDGTRIPVQIELAPIRDNSGRIRGVLHLSRSLHTESDVIGLS